jgi:hypothetical protein
MNRRYWAVLAIMAMAATGCSAPDTTIDVPSTVDVNTGSTPPAGD